MNKVSKESNMVIILLTLFVFISLVFSDAFARLKGIEEWKKRTDLIEPTKGLPFPQQRVHRMSQVNACMTNWGFLGSQMRQMYESRGGCFMDNPNSEAIAPSFEFPAGSGLEYLYQGGLWIGAKINDTVYTSVGCDGALEICELWPDSFPRGAIIERSTIPTAFCYSPDAISDQDLIGVYTDTSADIPMSPQQQDPIDNRPHHPLNVRITQKSYSWSIPGFDKFIITAYIIKNIGSYPLSQIYIGFYMDTDIMHIDETPWGHYGYLDDITGFLKKYEVFPGDTQEVDIAWAADNDGHGEMDGGDTAHYFTDKSPRSVIGMKLLYTSNPFVQISYNWWISAPSG
jgi:hypothetical protein